MWGAPGVHVGSAGVHVGSVLRVGDFWCVTLLLVLLLLLSWLLSLLLFFVVVAIVVVCCCCCCCYPDLGAMLDACVLHLGLSLLIIFDVCS